MTPKELIKRWGKLFNQGNSEEIAILYYEDAVNHQVTNDPVQGRENIQQMFEQEFTAVEMNCIVENIFEDGEWAILEWKDPKGLRGCDFFQVINGKIKFQRGYWDKLSFLRLHQLPLPTK